MADGYNPMRWDCEKRGCFNLKRRPKIEVFHDLFPGKISFGDVDGIVEINGKGLLIEWKSDTIDLPRGQQIMYKRLTAGKMLTVIIIVGNAETMRISHVGYVFNGEYSEPTPADMDRLREWIAGWVDFAYNRKMTHG